MWLHHRLQWRRSLVRLGSVAVATSGQQMVIMSSHPIIKKRKKERKKQRHETSGNVFASGAIARRVYSSKQKDTERVHPPLSVCLHDFAGFGLLMSLHMMVMLSQLIFGNSPCF